MYHRLALLAGLIAALPTLAQAQTWAAPYAIPRTSSSALSGNSCASFNQIYYVEDFAADIASPDVVYSLANGPTVVIPGRIPLILRGYGHARVRLLPSGWDASLWLCRVNTSGRLSQCIDASDNWGTSFPEEVNVPHEQGTFRIVVDGSVFTNWNCGGYTLEVLRDPW
jgi:hypothetical protein